MSEPAGSGPVVARSGSDFGRIASSVAGSAPSARCSRAIANAARSASTIACGPRPHSSTSRSAMSATIPCPFGGHSHTRTPRYGTETGSTQSERCDARSAPARQPPAPCTARATDCAIGPR